MKAPQHALFCTSFASPYLIQAVSSLTVEPSWTLSGEGTHKVEAEDALLILRKMAPTATNFYHGTSRQGEYFLAMVPGRTVSVSKDVEDAFWAWAQGFYAPKHSFFFAYAEHEEFPSFPIMNPGESVSYSTVRGFCLPLEEPCR